MQLVDGSNCSLVSSALLTAPNRSSLSMLGNIETTSQETRRVPAGNGPCSLSFSNLKNGRVTRIHNVNVFEAFSG